MAWYLLAGLPEATMILPFVSLAHADMAITCGTASVTGTVPANEATDVPIDVRPAVVLEGVFGPCAPDGWELELLRADDMSVVSSESFTAEDGEDGLLELSPPADLDPDTAYALRLTPGSGLGEDNELGFTTGSGTVTGLDGAPTLTISSAAFRAETLGVFWSAEAVEDSDQMSILQLRDPDLGVATSIMAAGRTKDLYAGWPMSRKPEEFCGEIIQIDGAGVATEAAQVDCLHVRRGCDSAGKGPSLAWLLACGLLFCRRGA